MTDIARLPRYVLQEMGPVILSDFVCALLEIEGTASNGDTSQKEAP
ncbi:hypothetical protein ROA7450_03381 [Roseovarius albus]|uniref:Uncharacterized protein n=1 Tax=Roseovarius albus TaxID=1247867 RepID=A0A1X6ZXA5_9RHOB|nr:hypothetical protein [Roseovarius albus]SLN64111.1 hypothetical protein ROA7450_03381 [Roseovarius albus]